MISIGVDPHKESNVAVAVDEAGRPCAEWRGANTAAGWQALLTWAGALGPLRQWGIEGAGGYGRGLAQHLILSGETVYEISPRWTADGRRHARRRDKSDVQDACAVAQKVRQEALTLLPLGAEDETAALDLLVTERQAALAEATRLRNRLHHLLHHLDPEYRQHLPSLTSQAGVRAVVQYTTTSPQPVQQARAAAVRRLGQRLQLALEQSKDLATQIRTLAAPRFAPLTAICGVDLLTAGALAGLLGPGQRFATDADLAAYAGVAPVEASSGRVVRHRLNRGGNRQLNAIVHRIAVTQARCSPQARAYLQRRQAEGKSWREAIRALKRHLARVVWQQWRRCWLAPGSMAAAAA